MQADSFCQNILKKIFKYQHKYEHKTKYHKPAAVFSGTGMDLAQGLNSPQNFIDMFTVFHSSSAKDILHSRSGLYNV